MYCKKTPAFVAKPIGTSNVRVRRMENLLT